MRLKSGRTSLRPSKRGAFLAAYLECGTVAGAAQAAGIAERTHYGWLKEPGYRREFARAKRQVWDSMMAVVHRLAIEGVRRYKFYKGKPVIDGDTGKPYYEIKHSTPLLILLLKADDPKRFGGWRRTKHKRELCR